jgi:chromosome segregation ATPase
MLPNRTSTTARQLTNLKLHRLPAIISLALIIALAGCTTSNYDPTTTSTGDYLWRNNDLQRHLADKRIEINQMQQEMVSLDDALLERAAMLASAQRRLASAAQTSEELEAVMQEIEELENEADKLALQAIDLGNKIASIEKAIEENHANVEQRIAELETEKQRFEGLKVEHDALLASIERTLKLRVAQLLQ